MLLKVNTQVSIKIIRFGTGNINTHWGVKHKKSPLLPIDHLFSDPVCGASQPSSQHRLAERVADHFHRWARFPNWNRHFHVLSYSIISTGELHFHISPDNFMFCHIVSYLLVNFIYISECIISFRFHDFHWWFTLLSKGSTKK